LRKSRPIFTYREGREVQRSIPVRSKEEVWGSVHQTKKSYKGQHPPKKGNNERKESMGVVSTIKSGGLRFVCTRTVQSKGEKEENTGVRIGTLRL